MSRLNPDEKWERFNKRLEELMRSNDPFGLGTTYYEMANFLEKEGRESSQIRKLGYRMKLRIQTIELKRLKESGVVKEVEIIATDKSCEACKQLNDGVLSIQEALLRKPIPVENCGHKYGCRCIYLPRVQ